MKIFCDGYSDDGLVFEPSKTRMARDEKMRIEKELSGPEQMKVSEVEELRLRISSYLRKNDD